MKKCGLYLRVSTERQAMVKEGSLQVQARRLKALVESKNREDERWKVTRIYSEEGCSGKDLNRPKAQQMLEDIRNNRIDVVLCTKVDRMSRSLMDFYYLFRLFNMYGVSFIILDDSFDTSNYMGRAILKLLLVFAELEREQTAERTKRSIYSRAKSGIRNGGHLLGYDIDKDNPGHLKVNKAEKAEVNLIFRTYLRTNSLKKTSDYLNKNGYRTKSYISRKGRKHGGKKFHSQGIVNILTNMSYIGKLEVNKRNKKDEQKELPDIEKYEVVRGRHAPIVDLKLFEKVQQRLKQNRRPINNKPLQKKYYYLLKGLFRCSTCGILMKTTWSRGNGGKYFYYNCLCKKKYIRADKFDERVISMVRKYVKNELMDSDSYWCNIVPGSIKMIRLLELSRRLKSKRPKFKKNILATIINAVYLNEGTLRIELK